MNLKELKNNWTSNKRITIPPPGFSLNKLDDLLSWLDEKVFPNEAGFQDLLPKELTSIVSGISIYSLAFKPSTDTEPTLLSFTLKWDNTTSWDIIPGEFSIKEIEININRVGKLTTALLAATLDIEGYKLSVSAGFPSGYIKAELDQKGPDKSPPSAADLFKRFKTGKLETKDGKTPTLNDFIFLADPRTKTAILHLGIDNINIGPVDIAAQLELNYYGQPKSQLTGALWSEYVIERPADPNNPVNIALLAEHDAPEKGWDFKGAVSVDDLKIGELITHFATFDETDKGPATKPFQLPTALANLELKIKYLSIEFNTATKNFSFSCEVDFFEKTQGKAAASPEVDFIIDFDLKRKLVPPPANAKKGAKPKATYEITFKGQVIFTLGKNKLAFDLVFDKTPGSTAFLAAYQDLAGGTISIGTLLHAIDPSITKDSFPLQISLKDAFLIYDKATTKGALVSSEKKPSSAAYLFGLDIGGGIELSHLPLVGKMFSSSDKLSVNFQALLAASPGNPFFIKKRVAYLSGLIPAKGIKLPDEDIASKILLSILLQAGDKSYPMEVPICLNKKDKSGNGLEDTSNTIANKQAPLNSKLLAAKTSDSSATGTPASIAGDITWYKLQKSFGPVSFNRIGFKYHKKEIWVLIDAALAAAGLTISLDGLGMETKLADIGKKPPTFLLNGLGLDFKRGPLEIGGSFLRQEIPAAGTTRAYEEYDGLVLISFKAFHLSAIGSYARVNGHTSLFIYGVLEMPFGGPPFLFVTGLAAGFGYNRRFVVPAIDQVKSFPLIATAMSGSAAVPSAPKDRGSFLQNEINSLSHYLPPQIGEYFLVAGLRFTSFELIDSFALLAISFGKDFELDILGLSTLVVPTPEEGSTFSPLAEVQLAIRVSFNPEAGYLEVSAQLTSSSFLLSRDCHLTGGFAFYVWFKNQPQPGALHGEFVLSIGGYHPKFKPPAYYPTVPRLGFNWQVTPQLFIKGGAYFALVPHAVMAGGGLEVVWHSGFIKAWFKAGADFLISWKPYFYMADIYVDLGVSATIHFFGTHHLTLELGADLSIWGPDFSGIAHIHLLVFTIPISFGNSKPKPKPISWKEFRKSLLPASDKICSISVEKGLIKKIEKDSRGHERWIINPKEFSLVTDAQIPSTQTIFGAEKKSGTIPFGVAPMALPSVGSSTHTVTLTGSSGELSGSPITKNMPAAMWGGQLSPDLNGKSMVEGLISGLRIQPKDPPSPGSTQSISRDNLSYEIHPIDKAYAYQTIHEFDKGSPESKSKINQSLLASKTVNKRNTLLSDLGFNLDITEIDLDPDLADSLVGTPEIGTWNF